MSQKSKKLVAILAISTSITKKKTKEKKLEWISSIFYSVIFKNQIEALFNLQSQVNIMSQVFTSQLGFKI